MRTKTIKRFYCDHCSKGMFRSADMMRHESCCIANPLRACFLCEVPQGKYDIKKIAEEFKQQLGVYTFEDFDPEDSSHGGSTSQEALKWLRKIVGRCPACMLAVIKQGEINAFQHFNYKEEKSVWHMEAINKLNPVRGSMV